MPLAAQDYRAPRRHITRASPHWILDSPPAREAGLAAGGPFESLVLGLEFKSKFDIDSLLLWISIHSVWGEPKLLCKKCNKELEIVKG
jgi:hypothetical protein